MELTIGEYLRLLRRKSWLIAIIIILGCSITFWYQTNYVSPIYEASSKVLMTHPAYPESEQQVLDFDTVRTNLMLMYTYTEVLTSQKVLEEVIVRNPDLNLSQEQLGNKLQVTTSSDSQVITLYVQDESYESAANLVNSIVVVFREALSDLLQVNNVTVLTEADPYEERVYPLNPNMEIYLIVAFIASAMLGVAIVTIIDYMNDTFRKEEDIKKYLDLPVVAVVPEIQENDSDNMRDYPLGKAGERKHAING